MAGLTGFGALLAMAQRQPRRAAAQPVPGDRRARRPVGTAGRMGVRGRGCGNSRNGARRGWTTSPCRCTWPARCWSSPTASIESASNCIATQFPPARWIRCPKARSGLDTHHVHDTLVGLRALGATLTVHRLRPRRAQFAALAQYPLDRLKIDRSFIRNVASDRAAPRSCAASSRWAPARHEGDRQGVKRSGARFLRRNHCDFFLGHLFSVPLPAEELGD